MIQKAKDILKGVGKKILHRLKGGDYGEYMDKRQTQTPEGKSWAEEVKKHGFWKALRNRKGWFSE